MENEKSGFSPQCKCSQYIFENKEIDPVLWSLRMSWTSYQMEKKSWGTLIFRNVMAKKKQVENRTLKMYMVKWLNRRQIFVYGYKTR